MANFIGGRLGRIIEVPSPSQRSWGSDMRVRVALDIRKPLLWFLNISSTSGEQLTVSVSYERLPLFCYICGMLGHIARQCEKQVEEGFVDPREAK
ncbi:UNVERIFIED_CONTAM: hypothetical protein Slati_2656600 [Sesamum latifolium]|uniref:CCHC-type domain-containing protein n=1 Tax=Sesamum latifolium TaxID=2727402 RepID=A0AAW2VUV8_9LAMI